MQPTGEEEAHAAHVHCCWWYWQTVCRHSSSRGGRLGDTNRLRWLREWMPEVVACLWWLQNPTTRLRRNRVSQLGYDDRPRNRLKRCVVHAMCAQSSQRIQSLRAWVYYCLHVCIYMDYYSFTDPGGMEGRVGLVGWPIADSLPTKWSPVNHRSDAGRGNSISQRPTSQPLSHAASLRMKIYADHWYRMLNSADTAEVVPLANTQCRSTFQAQQGNQFHELSLTSSQILKKCKKSNFSCGSTKAPNPLVIWRLEHRTQFPLDHFLKTFWRPRCTHVTNFSTWRNFVKSSYWVDWRTPGSWNIGGGQITVPGRNRRLCVLCTDCQHLWLVRVCV